MTVILNVEKREERGKQLARLRSAGKLPGIVYGPKEEAQPLSLDKAAFEKLMRDRGDSVIITLKGLTHDTEVLVQDVAFDPAKGGMTHVDFYAIERGKELTTTVPLEFTGEAPAEKKGGTLTKVMHEIEITCRPSNLPSGILVDISNLTEVDMQIKVSDLVIPEGVKVNENENDVVATVQAVVEEVEEVPAEVDMDAIEVEKKGKEESAEDSENKEGDQ
jgi:large subunit ribosomal protein L25